MFQPGAVDELQGSVPPEMGGAASCSSAGQSRGADVLQSSEPPKVGGAASCNTAGSRQSSGSAIFLQL